VLANAVASADPSATTASSSPRTYRLIANDSALTPHVGKKLELTGTIDDQGSAGSSSSSASAESAPKLRVESGKVIAEMCNP